MAGMKIWMWISHRINTFGREVRQKPLLLLTSFCNGRTLISKRTWCIPLIRGTGSLQHYYPFIRFSGRKLWASLTFNFSWYSVSNFIAELPNEARICKIFMEFFFGGNGLADCVAIFFVQWFKYHFVISLYYILILRVLWIVQNFFFFFVI